eukprot:gene5163-3711_t
MGSSFLEGNRKYSAYTSLFLFFILFLISFHSGLVTAWEDIDCILQVAAKHSFERYSFRSSSGVPAKSVHVCASEQKAYAKVYAFLSSFRKVEGYHHVYLLRLMLQTTVAAWVHQMCMASSHELHLCCNAESQSLHNAGSAPKSWSQAAVARWETFREGIHQRWVVNVPVEHVKDAHEHPCELNWEGRPVPLHSVVTFAMHFYAFRRILNTVFLRLWNPSASFSMADEVLFSIVKSILMTQVNMLSSSVMLVAQNLTDASKIETWEKSTGGDVLSSEKLTEEGNSNATYDDCASYAPLICIVAGLAEDCQLTNFKSFVTSKLESMCYARGLAVSTSAFKSLPKESVCNPEDQLNHFRRALIECVDGCRHVQRGIDMLFTGQITSYPSIGLTAWGSAMMAHAFYGYMCGVTAYSELKSVIDNAAVPLWLESCDRAHRSYESGDPGFLLPQTFGRSGGAKGAGYPLLLYLVSAVGTGRDRFQPLLSERIGKYLAGLLHDCDSGDAIGAASPQVLPLPSTVFEKCIFFLQNVWVIRSPDEPEPQSLPEIAMQTTLKGIHQFFAVCEGRAAATLAHALDYHVNGMIDGSHAAFIENTHSEAVHTLLDLTTLLTDVMYFSRLYADIIAPRVLGVRSVSALDVDNWVVALMESRLGSLEASPCRLLLRDMMEALQDQRTLCTKADSTSLTPSLQEHSSRRERGGAASSSPTLRLSLGSLGAMCPARPNPLLRRLRVLRCSRWKPYVTILQSSKSLQRMYEKARWFSEEIVDAVLRAEWAYNGNRDRHYQGYGSFGFLRNPLGNLLQDQPQSTDADDDGRSSMARISQSTSSMVAGFSSALTSAVQQATALTASRGLWDDDYDEDAAFSGAYGGMLRQEVSGSWTPENVSLSSLNSHPTSRSVPSATESSACVEEKRKMKWSLGSGQLTFAVKDPRHAEAKNRDGKRQHASVLVTGPPICFLLLQMMSTTTELSPLTFGNIISHLPLKVPKEVVGQVLKAFLSAGLTKRKLCGERYAYYIAPSFATIESKTVHITVQYKDSRALVPDAAPEDACPASTTPTETTSAEAPTLAHSEESNSPEHVKQKRAKMDIAIMRILKKESTLSHTDLLTAVMNCVGPAYHISLPDFKSSISVLLERECVYRNEHGSYTIEPPRVT